MGKSIRFTAGLGIVAAFALSGCAPAPSSSSSSSSPSSAPAEASPSSDAAEPTGVSFADGDALPADVEVNLGDSLASDPGWTRHPDAAPGRWAYASADGNCTAAYRQGSLGAEPGMDDRTATDALVTASTGWSLAELEPLLDDGRFVRYGVDGEFVEHRQFTLSVDGSGVFFAARAFVASDYSVEVTVMCRGVDVTPVAFEVLSKTQVQVAEP